MILLISFSLNPKSKSYKSLKAAYDYLKSRGVEAKIIDLREYDLPFYDGTEEILANSHIKEIFDIFNSVEKIIIAAPIYNFDVNANLKNFIDLLSVTRYKNLLNNKQVIGMIGAMGSEKGFTSLLLSLSYFQFSLGFYLIPKIVMSEPKDFNEKNEVSTVLENRIQELCNTIIQVSLN